MGKNRCNAPKGVIRVALQAILKGHRSELHDHGRLNDRRGHGKCDKGEEEQRVPLKGSSGSTNQLASTKSGRFTYVLPPFVMKMNVEQLNVVTSPVMTKVEKAMTMG